MDPVATASATVEESPEASDVPAPFVASIRDVVETAASREGVEALEELLVGAATSTVAEMPEAASVGELWTSTGSGGLKPEGKLGLKPKEGLEGVEVVPRRPDPEEVSADAPRAGDAQERMSRENPKRVG